MINAFNTLLTIALSYEEIKIDPQKIIKIKPFRNKYDLEVTIVTIVIM